jgi:hypothetical protein
MLLLRDIRAFKTKHGHHESEAIHAGRGDYKGVVDGGPNCGGCCCIVNLDLGHKLTDLATRHQSKSLIMQVAFKISLKVCIGPS